MLIKNFTYLTIGYLSITLTNGNPLVDKAVCTVEKGVNYLGNDIGQAPSPSVEQCCDLCKKVKGCAAFTWNKFNGGVCWFKSKKDKTAQDPTCSSSTVSGVEVPVTTCKVEKGVNIVGGDIGSKPCSSSDQCCELCDKFPGCKAFTWSKANGGTCWFKSKKAKVIPDLDCDSSVGVVIDDEPPKPTCKVEDSVCYLDNDVGNVPAADPCLCYDKCKAFKGCNTFTWTKWNGGTCWLKSKKDKTTNEAGCFSAVVNDLPVVNPTCKVEKGVNIVGGDIGSKECSSSDKCCELCDKFPGCKAFTWSKHNGGTCWFKNSQGQTIPDPSCDSSVGVVVDPKPTCTLEKDIDYFDNDIGNVPAKKAAECCDKCKAFKGCKVFTWSDANGGTCWLKSKKGKVVNKPGVVSSVVDSTPDTVPEPSCKIEKNIDYVDNDIGNVPAAEACLCHDKCKAFKGCQAFSWSSYSGGTCWLKSKKDKTAVKEGVYSSVVDVPNQGCGLENGIDYVDTNI